MPNPVMKDFVQDTTTTTGTGTLTLADATISNRRKPSAVFANGEKVFYAILGGTELESGCGTFTTAGTTLSRDTIIESTNSNNAVSFSAGTKTVVFGLPAAVAQSLVPPFWSGQGIFSSGSGIPIPSAKVASVRGITTGAGEFDLYTVPAGHRACLTSAFSGMNNNAATATIYFSIKHSGAYQRITSSSSPVAGANVNLSGGPVLLEAGDAFAVNCTHSDVLLVSRATVFPDSCALKSANIFSIANGDNTLYTCPSGKIAIPCTSLGNINNGTVVVSNASGGSVTYKTHAVLSGGSAGVTNQLASSTVSNNSTSSFSQAYALLTAGDSIVLNSSSGAGTQSAYFTYWELPAP